MKRRLAAGLPAVLFTILVATSSRAQVVDVPTFPAGSPTFAAHLQEIDVAPHPDGGFVVIWGEFGNTLGPGNRIVDHRFSRDGVEVTPPLRIDASGYGLYPNITETADGGFIAAWMWSKEGTARALYARRLDGGGYAISGETRVDTPSTGPMISSAVACRTSGCVYFWKQNGLWVRAYDKFGTPMTSAVRVGDNTPAFEADIDVLPGGGFVVVWTNLWMEDYSWARIYKADLTPLGPAFPIDKTGFVDEVTTSSKGEIAVVGHASFPEGSPGGARGETWMRRFKGNGTPIGSRVVVRTAGPGVLTQADADYDSRGNLFVVWREYDQDTNLIGPARARAYDATGAPFGPDFDLTGEPATEIQTTVLKDDCFANAWYVYGRASANVVCLCGGSGGGDGCGDGELNASCEICDDGNTTDGDGCDSNCTPSECGNGKRAADEECDDGNLASGDGCDENCTKTACGNGIPTAGEQCDDGNTTSDDGCDADCRVSGCGNGNLGSGEECDDGNVISGDGCDEDCTKTGCGNGIRTGKEACDDGNDMDGDGCDSNCTLSACGNGIPVGEEECDDGNGKSGDGCDRNCLVEACGNGRREDNEECDEGAAGLVGDEGEGDGEVACNPDCTLREVHDSVVLQRDPVAVSIPDGNSPFRSNVVVQVQNADVNPVRESPGHTIQLIASDGDCPPGTVTGQPDFDRGKEGAQDTTQVDGGLPSTAIAEITVSREGFVPFGPRIPSRCTLWFTAVEAGGTSDDPTPDNNILAVALDVTDTRENHHEEGEDEFYVESMKPITIKLAKGQTLLTKQIKPSVRRSRDLPKSVSDVEVNITASDGDCPKGTVGFVDFDRRAAGAQSRLMLKRGRRSKGSLGLIIRAEAFDSPSDESPRRCTALITASGAGDTDKSNNTTRLVIDVIDRNDY